MPKEEKQVLGYIDCESIVVPRGFFVNLLNSVPRRGIIFIIYFTDIILAKVSILDRGRSQPYSELDIQLKSLVCERRGIQIQSVSPR